MHNIGIYIVFLNMRFIVWGVERRRQCGFIGAFEKVIVQLNFIRNNQFTQYSYSVFKYEIYCLKRRRGENVTLTEVSKLRIFYNRSKFGKFTGRGDVRFTENVWNNEFTQYRYSVFKYEMYCLRRRRGGNVTFTEGS